MTGSARLGYALAAIAAAMWAVNGSLARFLLDDGVSPWHLTLMRCLLSSVLLFAYLGLFRRDQLRIGRGDLKPLIFLGVCGMAAVQSTYFAAIERIDVGVVLTIQYTGPLLLLIWLWLRHGQKVGGALWGAVALSAFGSFFVVEAYDLDGIDGIGLIFSVAAAVTFAINLAAMEHAGKRLSAVTALAYGFGFAALFWLIVRPPWTFPFERFDNVENLAYGLGVAVVGTLVPFVLMVTALKWIPAPRAGVVATLEPVLAAILAWPLLDQALSAPQLAGIVIVCVAVGWVQLHRPDVEEEQPPLVG